MRKRERLTTAIVLGLFFSLAAGSGARLTLDARTTFDFGSHVETEHATYCSWGHDHQLCVLVHYTPWSVGADTLRIEVNPPRFDPASVGVTTVRYELRVRPRVARSPPRLS